ncbi:MAG: hypothetical protein P8Y97_15630, partial [Candidatus Lokiarchaeota archaeon]
AAETSFRFFQTVDLILSHFKREADKSKIFELIDQDANLSDVLISAATIHIYHNLGIRVEEDLKGDEVSDTSSKNLEVIEKKKIFKEVKKLIRNSFDLEINMLSRIITLENMILNHLIEVRESVISEDKKKEALTNIEQYIEQELLEIVLMEHPFYFYDLIGDIIGYSPQMKREIFEEGAELKDISIEIEERLRREEKDDKFIELSTLRRTIDKIHKDFEFKSYKEMKMSAMPVRMVKRKIKDFEINKFPISIPGLKAYKDANLLKEEIIERIKSALNEKIDYPKFEKDLLDYLKSNLINKLKQNPNDFIYFLEFLNETNFSDIIYELRKYGIYNVLEILNIDHEIIDKVKRNMIRYNIDKFDLMDLNEPKRNLIYKAKEVYNKLDFSEINGLSLEEVNDNNSLINFLMQNKDKSEDLWKKMEGSLNFSLIEFREFCRKKQIIEKIFLNDLKINSLSQILAILEFEKVINELLKETLYYILSKILRQLSRIIESYSKITNEKSLFYLAIKKMESTKKSEEWVSIKLEELLIQRIIKRQEELAIVFDALNQPFLVNGFLYARLTDTSLQEGIEEFKENVSLIYKNIKPLRLKEDLISPVSYCLGFDLVKRFEIYDRKRKEERKRIKKLKEQKKQEKKEEIRKKQEDSTLNWIERRITSSLMRVGSPGINPNQLYWQEKDTKTAIETIKIHGDLSGEYVELLTEYFIFAKEKIEQHYKIIKLPGKEKIVFFIENIVNQVLEKRLGRKPNKEEIKSLLDGEKFEISSQIAKKIGQMLNKALYKKFKDK